MYTQSPRYEGRPLRRRGPMADPFLRRLAILVAAFVLLLPIAAVFARGSGHVVKATGLPGGTLTATPVEPATSAAPTTTRVARSATPGTTAATATPTRAVQQPRHHSASSIMTKRHVTARVTQTTVAKKKHTMSGSKPTVKVPAKRKIKPAPPTSAPRPKPAPRPPVVVPVPPVSYSAAAVVAIVRSVWPAQLADRAIAIADRESHLTPTSHNWCCYGLFAIYFQAGRSLLAKLGITSPTQLFDPLVNTKAAYAIYLAAGWGPWS